MILVDSSVWIDFYRGVPTREADLLDRLLDRNRVFTGDLIVAEVLQGFSDQRSQHAAEQDFRNLPVIAIGGAEAAFTASRNYRVLRGFGVTVRKTIDTLIATRCILDGFELLHRDRDFDGFERYLGLRVVSVPAAS